MMSNTTCLPGNSTTDCIVEQSQKPNVGLAVGLSLFILLLVVIVLIYMQHNKLKRMWALDQLKSKEFNTDQPESSQYTGMVRTLPCSDDFPIYENFTESKNRNRSTSEPEDIYLQCDTQDDAIYSNDPSCSLAMLPSVDDDSLYIMPDVL
ncbi:hypothetical protein UPYG_G00297960 [Umbra pygmaea]|uniref:Uncharacterized protein n=1 Tax=Umbra pygmaea TaxID=75934 RepID=A0ABD0WMA1_UMBPY